MLLISPLNCEERTSWGQPSSPRVLDQVPSSGLASLTGIGTEADVMRGCQDRRLRPTTSLPRIFGPPSLPRPKLTFGLLTDSVGNAAAS